MEHTSQSSEPQLSENEQKLYVDNFLEALKQIQQYIVLGLGTSGSALALVLHSSSNSDHGITMPWFYVNIDAHTARSVLLVICILVGAMAYYCAETAHYIEQRLRETSFGVLQAASTYPCVATSPYPLVRYLASGLPWVLSLCALVLPALKDKTFSWEMFWAWFVFLSPYLMLMFELRQPIGEPPKVVVRKTKMIKIEEVER